MVFSGQIELCTNELKRAVLCDFQIRMRVGKVPPPKEKRRVLEVTSVRIGVFRDDLSVYKKMKRLGIE